MNDRALKLFTSAWDRIKQGQLFDEPTNTAFEYMIKSLWKSEYHTSIKTDILKHFPSIYAHARTSENPPPLFYILISLRDTDIIKEMQSLILMDWIKNNADENSTYQILNFTQTFSEKNIPIDNFVNTIIKRISLSMSQEMIEALSHMLTIQHPGFMPLFLKKFLSFANQDDTLLKSYVQMNGRKAFLELVKIAPPEMMHKIFKAV
jgi:hypothetical protein